VGPGVVGTRHLLALGRVIDGVGVIPK